MTDFDDRGRTQPEFSLGERMATMEANIARDAEHRREMEALRQELFEEKISSVRAEVDVKDKAQKEATGKAEKSAAETASALATELKSSRETTDARLGALERGGALGLGETTGGRDRAAGEYAIRAERTANRAMTAAIVGGGFGFIGIIVAIIKAVGG